MKEPIYKPFKLLAIGEQFIDIDFGKRFMKVACTMHDSGKVHTASICTGGAFNRQTVNCVSMEPYTFQNKQYSAGELCYVEQNEAVQILETAPEAACA